MQYTVIKDKYTRARGGSAKLYQIFCNKCNHQICIYQKDGPGNLLRMYLDKFVAPKNLIEVFKTLKTKKDIHGLNCHFCNELIGVPIIYEKENRLAFRLIPNKIIKKEIDIKMKWFF